MPNFKIQVIVSYITAVTVEAPSEREAEILVINHPERYLNNMAKISSSVETFDAIPTDEPATPIVPAVTEQLIYKVIQRIAKDLEAGDVTALETMLSSLAKQPFASLDAYNILKSYLPEI